MTADRDWATRAQVLLRLAEHARDLEPADPSTVTLLRSAALVITDHDTPDLWDDLGWELQRRDDVEDVIAPQFRAVELDACDRGIAGALWALLHGHARACRTCLDSHTGEPHEVAAKTQPAGGCQWHDQAVAS